MTTRCAHANGPGNVDAKRDRVATLDNSDDRHTRRSCGGKSKVKKKNEIKKRKQINARGGTE